MDEWTDRRTRCHSKDRAYYVARVKIKTGGLRHDGSSEKLLGQYFPSFLQCVNASHNK